MFLASKRHHSFPRSCHFLASDGSSVRFPHFFSEQGFNWLLGHLFLVARKFSLILGRTKLIPKGMQLTLGKVFSLFREGPQLFLASRRHRWLWKDIKYFGQQRSSVCS